MAATHMLEARQFNRCPSGYYYSNGFCYRSSWYSWGRWVLVGCLILAALVFLFLCSCFARRRRRSGSKPVYGTGWMSGGKWGNNNNNNNNDNNQYQMNNAGYNQGYGQPAYNQYPPQGAPAYPQQEYPQQAQNTGTTFNPNDGYYGAQQYGGNVQQPPNAYQRDGGYAPPEGPPPGKKVVNVIAPAPEAENAETGQQGCAGLAESLATVTKTFKANVTKSLEWRITQLRKAWWMLEDNKEAIVDALSKDLNKHRQESLPVDVAGVQAAILEALDGIKSWTADERPRRTNPLNLLAGARIRREPKGVALIVAAWNYPFMELFEPMAAALAAGCAVVLKPSELAPASQDLIARIVPRYLDPRAVRVVTAGPAEMDHLLGHRFDHIFFTGSTAVGKIVYARAAPHLTTVTLELGGRGPAIVTPSADIDLAARRIANTKFLNAGQVCVGVNHVFVDPSVKKPFLAALAKYFDKFLAGKPAERPDYATTIVNDRHYSRLEGLLERSSGNIIYGGHRDPETRYFAPTVVDNVATDDALLSEELFGPILPVLDATLDEAIAYTAAHDHPLALYGYTNSAAEQREILARTASGGVTFNDGILHMAIKDAPFGGVGGSGTGAYHGVYGFNEFTHLRTVASVPGWMDALLRFRYPPYTDAKAAQQIKATGGGGRVSFDREGRSTTTALGVILGQWKLLVLVAVVLRWRGWTLDDLRSLFR